MKFLKQNNQVATSKFESFVPATLISELTFGTNRQPLTILNLTPSVSPAYVSLALPCTRLCEVN
jgi:hypothetical protein